MLAKLHDDGQIADVVANIIATGDGSLRAAAAAQVILFAMDVHTQPWRETHRARLVKGNTASGLAPTPEEVDWQLGRYQAGTLARLYRILGALGGEAAADYAFAEASDTSSPLDLRMLALDLAENLAASGARRHADDLSKLSADLHAAKREHADTN